VKKILFIFLILFLTGCTEDEVTLQKDDYLVFKEELLKTDNFTEEDDLLLDLNVYTDRINEEEISYRLILDNPKENMYNIKAMVVHNQFTDSIFPSIGIFDEPIDLIMDNEEVKGINLTGYIKTIKEIEKLDLEVRVYIEYTNELEETKKIYYKTTI